MQEYLSKLNEAQKQAVINTEGPALVIAGAGSGKTRVLTYRIAHLLNTGKRASEILALTFTNKAAREMKERIGELIGKDKAAYLWMGTFHSIFAKILRYEAEHIGYPNSFTIYDTQDSKSIVKQIIKDLKLDDNYNVKNVYGKISKAKNNLITSAAYARNNNYRAADEKSQRPEFHRVYSLYEKRCFNNGAMDFDDLLLKTNILFREHPDVLEKYQKRFNYLLVDEYQDTNYSQYLIIKKLAEKHQNVCVVGDDAQSIYAFRGAKIENILNFRKDYKNFRLFKLERNYRSTANIVEAANSVIEKNKNRIEKKVFAHGEQGKKVKILQSLTDNEEGYRISGIIYDSVYRDHTGYGDHAILYRTNAQSRIFEEALRRRNIPYKIYGSTSFYQRKEIKDILAYCKLTCNTKDNEALKRIINYPRRGIGQTSVDKLEAFAQAKGVSIWEGIEILRTEQSGVNKRALNQILAFADMIKIFENKLEESDAYSLASFIASQSGVLKDLFADKAPEQIERHKNVQELLNGIKEFTEKKENLDEARLNHYLEEVSLLTDLDDENKEDQNKVSLMTIHAAKGLEFENVYIGGMEEGLFPNEMSAANPKDLEEERRLFYVALTRAKKELFVSYANQRYRWGKLIDTVPARFVKEIDRKYLDLSEAELDLNESQDKFKKSSFVNFQKKNYYNKPNSYQVKNSTPNPANLRPLRKRQPEKSNPKTFSSNSSGGNSFVRPGAKVRHSRFGVGTVLSLENSAPDTKAKILFPGAGEKVLLLKYAKLMPAD